MTPAVPSFFNVFNIVATLAILAIGYYMYKKFTTKFKKGAIKVHFKDEVEEVFVPKAEPESKPKPEPEPEPESKPKEE